MNSTSASLLSAEQQRRKSNTLPHWSLTLQLAGVALCPAYSKSTSPHVGSAAQGATVLTQSAAELSQTWHGTVCTYMCAQPRREAKSVFDDSHSRMPSLLLPGALSSILRRGGRRQLRLLRLLQLMLLPATGGPQAA